MTFKLDTATSHAPATIAIVGSPNVGKSVVFHRLTGQYVVVSNYPGTTVEVSRGRARLDGGTVEVIDTPGMYSLLPISDEERVARRLLLGTPPQTAVHVVDAKNLERMLPLTLQLIELGLPVALILNVMDEARRLGVVVDSAGLAADLGVPVAEAVATRRRGFEAARRVIAAGGARAAAPVDYGPDVERTVAAIAARLPAGLSGSARGIALLLLQGDAEIADQLFAADPHAAADIATIVADAGDPEELSAHIISCLHARARELAGRHLRLPATATRTWADRLHDLAVQPITGVPILLAILYFGLYQFVGVFGAGDLVDWLGDGVFGEHLNPWVNAQLESLLPEDGWQYWIRELVGGEYGIVTLGVTYAIAIILPIVSLFFLFFSLLEDSGYFPRLALLVDRLFKRIGLNGRAVIPIVLGFGCDTMATMVTRIQETRRERFITTLLLAVAIPCSAQYGVVTGLLASQPAGVLGVSYAFLAWAGIMLAAFILTGLLASRLVPGHAASFYMELPPMRMPRLSNVLAKTMARMKWYFLEVLPLFVLASLAIWVGRITGLFDAIIAALRPIVNAIGLPDAAAPAFLYGFFRRDFGAAGLFGLAEDGSLSGAQLLVACVTLTLFLPCVAQLLIMRKERGLRVTAATAAGIFAGAFLVGGAVNAFIQATGVTP